MKIDCQVDDRPHLRVLVRLVVSLIWLVLASACVKEDLSETNTTDPRWVVQKTPKSKVAVVFVHGIFGDTLGTWTRKNKKTLFEYLAETPDVGPKLDMFAFGFTSNMITPGSFDIQEAANKLHESLKFYQVLDYPAIVYVTHSMGGLVVLQHLLTRREQLEKVPLIVFYATPQEGSQITTIAKDIANNPALEQMLPADRNAFLRQLNDQWKSLQARPPIVCGYEKLATKGIMVVPWSSATRFCDGAPSAIADADHITIVKPDRPTHDSLVLLINALNTYVVGKQLAAKLETPDFVPEGDHFTFTLLDPYGRSPARLVNSGGSKLSFTLTQISDPSLYLSPDTPKEIPARQTQNLRIALGFGAVASEYRFVLKSDATSDQQVVVRVPDLAALRANQTQLVEAVNRDISKFLSVPENRYALAKLPAEDTRASTEVVRVVLTTVAKHSPELPESAQWVVSADLLAASNWPRLAATALRFAEIASPTTVNSSSVQHLAGVVAAQSGEGQIFKNAEVPKILSNQLPKLDLMKLMFKSNPSSTSEELAANLQTVPSLKTYGLSLEGDIWQAKGNKSAALTAYKASEAIFPSPSISGRVTALEAFGGQSPGSLDFKYAPKEQSTDRLLMKPEARRENLIKGLRQDTNRR